MLVGFHVGWQGNGDQSDAVTQNAWFRCALCTAISGEISILIQTGEGFLYQEIALQVDICFLGSGFLSNDYMSCLQIPGAQGQNMRPKRVSHMYRGQVFEICVYAILHLQ